MLAGLVAQAEDAGADMLTVRAIVEEASMLGAERALGRLGLCDADAGTDVRELRQLLQGWRDAKRAAGAAVLGWLVRLLTVALLFGLAARADLLGMLRQ